MDAAKAMGGAKGTAPGRGSTPRMSRPVKLPAVALVCLALLLGACQRSTDQVPGKTTLEFWTVSLKPVFNDYINDLMRRYEAQHPDIHLVWLDAPIDAVVQKLQASIAGGVSPDVVNLNTDYAFLLAQKGALVSMDEAVSDNVKRGYFPGLWNAARYQGVNYALPWYVTLQVTMYNSAIFQKAGLDRPPTTWDEAAQDARIIKQKTGEYGFQPYIKLLDDFQMYGIPILSPDHKRAVFNSPAAVARLQWYVDLFQQDLVPRDTLTRGYQGALDRYTQGDLGMLFSGPQFLKRIHDNQISTYKVTKVAPLPKTPTGIVAAATMNFVVPRASKHREQAIQLAEFLTNDENQLNFCKLVAILPSRIEAAHNPYFTERGDKTIDDQAIKLDVGQLAAAQDLSLGLPHEADLSRAIKEALEGALLGRKTAQQALDDAVAQWNAILGSASP